MWRVVIFCYFFLFLLGCRQQHTAVQLYFGKMVFFGVGLWEGGEVKASRVESVLTRGRALTIRQRECDETNTGATRAHCSPTHPREHTDDTQP